MNIKVFSLVLMLMITVTGVWAQNLPARPGSTNSVWSSPQSSTTEGRYRSNADDFIRPDAYTNLKFDKWFGLVSFLWDPSTYDAIATAGFATKAGGLYISAFYSGNFWAGAPENNYIIQEPDPVPAGGDEGKTYTVYKNGINVSGATNTYNNVAVLIGFADMGIRLTYLTNHQIFDKNDIVTGDQLYKSYREESGYIAPQIAWAMSKNLTSNGIKPYATIDLVFQRDYQITETNGADAAGNTGAKVGRSANHFDPSLSLGLGGYTFLNIDGFRLSCDLDYVLTLNIYDNEYNYIEDGKNKTGNIKGTYSPGVNTFVEKSYVQNKITPSLSGQWGKDNLALRFKFNLVLDFIGKEDNSMMPDPDNSSKLVYGGSSYSYSTFTFQPDIRLAFQYKIIPDKLTLNAGARIQASAITLETITVTDYIDGDKKATSEIHNESFGTTSNFRSRFSIGPTFNLTENLWIEATTGVTNAFGNEGTIDIFAPGGLFSFGSIMVALKF
jgi:hypothetical protein